MWKFYISLIYIIKNYENLIEFQLNANLLCMKKFIFSASNLFNIQSCPLPNFYSTNLNINISFRNTPNDLKFQ